MAAILASLHMQTADAVKWLNSSAVKPEFGGGGFSLGGGYENEHGGSKFDECFHRKCLRHLWRTSNQCGS
jgi:hypothetical protein